MVEAFTGNSKFARRDENCASVGRDVIDGEHGQRIRLDRGSSGTAEIDLSGHATQISIDLVAEEPAVGSGSGEDSVSVQMGVIRWQELQDHLLYDESWMYPQPTSE